MQVVDDPDLHLAYRAWIDDQNALPLVQLHLSRGERLEAGAVARAALEGKDCPNAEEIERLLDELDEPTAEWRETLRTFAAAPSVERWRELMQFVPEDLIYQRLRNSIRQLCRMGADPDILFLCACELGMTPDAIKLVEDGLVKAGVVEERGRRARGAQATYFGLAAIAAYLAGDVVGTVRLIRMSLAQETDLCPSWPHILFIRERASAEVNAVLDDAGIPGLDAVAP